MTLIAELPRYARSTLALTWFEFRDSWRNLRFLITVSVVGFLIVLLAWRLGAVAAEGSVASYPVWHLGADGALAAHAFGFVPLLLPIIPLVLAYQAVRRHEASGYVETLLSRSVPRYVSALGIFVGLFLVTALAGLILGGASVLVITAAVGEGVSGGFAGAFLGGTVLLGGLYLGASLVLLRYISPGLFAWLSPLVWAVANGVRSLGLVISGQFLLIVPIRGPAPYSASFADWLSFTGVYFGAMAPSVPPALGLVVPPTILDLGGLLAYTSLAAAPFLWLGFLILLYVILVLRQPLVR